MNFHRTVSQEQKAEGLLYIRDKKRTSRWHSKRRCILRGSEFWICGKGLEEGALVNVNHGGKMEKARIVQRGSGGTWVVKYRSGPTEGNVAIERIQAAPWTVIHIMLWDGNGTWNTYDHGLRLAFLDEKGRRRDYQARAENQEERLMWLRAFSASSKAAVRSLKFKTKRRPETVRRPSPASVARQSFASGGAESQRMAGPPSIASLQPPSFASLQPPSIAPLQPPSIASYGATSLTPARAEIFNEQDHGDASGSLSASMPQPRRFVSAPASVRTRGFVLEEEEEEEEEEEGREGGGMLIVQWPSARHDRGKHGGGKHGEFERSEERWQARQQWGQGGGSSKGRRKGSSGWIDTTIDAGYIGDPVVTAPVAMATSVWQLGAQLFQLAVGAESLGGVGSSGGIGAVGDAVGSAESAESVNSDWSYVEAPVDNTTHTAHRKHVAEAEGAEEEDVEWEVVPTAESFLCAAAPVEHSGEVDRGSSQILLDTEVCQLAHRMPMELLTRGWRRLDSTAQDGASMATLLSKLRRGGTRVGLVGGGGGSNRASTTGYSQVNGYSQMDLVVLVQDMHGTVFGGLLTQFETRDIPCR
jgi:hypothetical protein